MAIASCLGQEHPWIEERHPIARQPPQTRLQGILEPSHAISVFPWERLLVGRDRETGRIP